MTANRYYGVNNKSLAGSLEKLASGYAINKAGDNAAGLAVSEKMRAQIGGLTQASKNAEDGISMVQTFEGALQETDSILQRMRTLAVQSANGSYQNEVDRDAIQLEFDQLNDELNQIADTDFNGVVMLNGGIMADGTVANNTSKVAARPSIDKISSEPDTAFTYKNLVSGSIDGAGNGSMAINGVSFNLTNGEGSATLGSTASGGVTRYSTLSSEGGTPISVTNGKATGTVAATETYKIDEGTTNIEIHGKNYSVDSANQKLFDSDNNEVNLIDGLAVTVKDGKSVTLSGKYELVDNELSIKTFSGADDSATITNNTANWENTARGGPTISGTSIVVNEDDTLNATVLVNGASINVENGSGAGAVSGSVTYGASDVKQTDSATGAYTATITANGTPLTARDVTSATNISTEIDYYGVDGNLSNATDWASNPTNSDIKKAQISFTDAVTGSTVTVTAKKDATGAIKLYDKEDTEIATLGDDAAEITFYAKTNGDSQKTADTDSVSTFTISLSKSSIADGLKVASQQNKVYTDEGLGHGTKLYANVSDQTTILTTSGDSKAKIATGGASVSLGNGLVFDATAKSASGSFVITGNMSSTDIGSFEFSKGVSTSDAYNHGSRNLTFADSMTLQVGARSKDAVNFNFSYTTNGIGTLKADMNASARGLGTDQLSVKDQESANYAIDQIDNAINKTNMIRATFGSIQNRLEHKINNIDTNTENLTAAESRIRDTQMDKEMMKFTSSQILSQASQSMLAQANQLPQGVLQLLG